MSEDQKDSAKTGTDEEEKLTVNIPLKLKQEMQHLGIDLKIKLKDMVAAAYEKFVAKYKGREDEVRDKLKKVILPEGGEKTTFKVPKTLSKAVKHLAIDLELDLRGLTIHACTEHAAALSKKKK